MSYIGISSLDVFNNMRFVFGTALFPSHKSNWQINTLVEGDISFWRRVINFIDVWSFMYRWMNVCVSREDALAKKYLGKDTPHILDITRNMSIYLTNRHPLFTYGRPEQTNLVFFHGFHIAKTPPALPEVHIYYHIIFSMFSNEI